MLYNRYSLVYIPHSIRRTLVYIADGAVFFREVIIRHSTRITNPQKRHKSSQYPSRSVVQREENPQVWILRVYAPPLYPQEDGARTGEQICWLLFFPVCSFSSTPPSSVVNPASDIARFHPERLHQLQSTRPDFVGSAMVK